MLFQQRSFPGDQYTLPTPDVFFDHQEKLLIIATPWGAPAGAKKLVQTIADYFLATKSDKEATSPFKRLDYLSTTANNLRIATLVANEILYREENRSEYVCGVELFAAAMHERELNWVQVGHPNVLLSREGQNLLPLNVSLSLANEVESSKQNLPPLPSNMIGISPEPNLFVQSICPKKSDALILLSRSWVPKSIFQPDIKSFEDLSHALSIDGNEPYWLGHWSLNKE